MLPGIIGALLAVQAHAQPYPSPTLQNVSVQGTLNVLGASTFTGKAVTAATAATGAGFSLPPGVAPTAPTNGDLWMTPAGLYARINGVTVQIGTGPGSGTVTSVSVSSANGFGGTVASPTSTPAISITTSITGLLKGNGTAVSAATAGSDYLLPTGSGASLTGLSYSQLPVIAANSLLGALTSATPSGQAVPSCSGANQGLNWTSGTGFGCVTFSGGGGGSLAVTDGTTTYTGTTQLQVASAKLSGSASAAVFSPQQPVYNKTTSYTLGSAETDLGAQVNFKAPGSVVTVTFPATIFAAQQSVVVLNTSPQYALTVANAGTYNLLGLTTLSLPPNSGLGCTSDGTNFNCATFGYPSVNPYLGTAETWTATQTFGPVNGASNVVSGSTYTMAASDCGKTIIGTNAGAATYTIAASIVPAVGTTCVISVLTTTANKISVNGSAVTQATLVNPSGYVGTTNVAGSQIVLTLTTVGSTATAFLAGNGS